ncbi:MAG: hypothetical protein JRI41_09220 [Deltaproteobacteria bacterium]|nr:hypothetical protein [Deltaproteobacteria bacterium]
MPDSSAIKTGSLSKDLEKGKFFESFTVLLHPKVKEECNKTRGGKREMARIADFSSIGRIRLIEAACEDMQLPADDLIVEGARRNNAIIYTGDKTMYATSNSKNMFCLKSV